MHLIIEKGETRSWFVWNKQEQVKHLMVLTTKTSIFKWCNSNVKMENRYKNYISIMLSENLILNELLCECRCKQMKSTATNRPLSCLWYIISCLRSLIVIHFNIFVPIRKMKWNKYGCASVRWVDAGMVTTEWIF